MGALCNLVQKFTKFSAYNTMLCITLLPVALITMLFNHCIVNNLCGRFDIDDNEDEQLMDLTNIEMPERVIQSPPHSEEPQRGQQRKNAFHILYFCSAIPFCIAINLTHSRTRLLLVKDFRIEGGETKETL